MTWQQAEEWATFRALVTDYVVQSVPYMAYSGSNTADCALINEMIRNRREGMLDALTLVENLFREERQRYEDSKT